MGKKRRVLQTFVLTLIILCAFFQNWLLMKISAIKYLDELIAMLCLCYFFINGKITRISKQDLKIFCFMSVLILFGVFCNFKFSIQTNLGVIFTDIVSTFKFLFVYWGSKKYVSCNRINKKEIIRNLCFIIKPFVLILAILAVINLFRNIGFSSGSRYGLNSFAFVYGTAGHLINQMTYVVILLHAEAELCEKKVNGFWLLLCGIIMVCTLKTRAFLLIAVYMALVYFLRIRKKRRIGTSIIIIGFLVALLGYSQFEHYFMNDGTPRQMFVKGAIKLVKQYFPFGTGFATYGSSAAADYYSKLYYQLGFSSRWGMAPTSKLFLNDNYLPMIFGQFGLIAGFFFLVLLAFFCFQILKDDKVSSSINARMITYAYLADILLSSVQSSYLAHYSVVTLTFVFVLLMYPYKTK